MGVAKGVDIEPAALLAHIETEGGVEFLRLRQVRDREVEMVKRVHAELARAAADRLVERSDLRHRTPPPSVFGCDHNVRRIAGKATTHCGDRSRPAAPATSVRPRRS